MSEAYDSDSSSSSSSSSSSGSIAQQRTLRDVNGRGGYEDDSEGEVEDGEDDGPIEWEKVLPVLRTRLVDPSRKRREEFVHKYLKITDNDPPTQYIPQIFTSILSCLSSATIPQHIDLLIHILLDISRKDHELPEGRDRKLGLSEKLLKWTHMEVNKIGASITTLAPTAMLPYIFLLLSLLSYQRSLFESQDAFITSPTFINLVLALSTVLDRFDAQLGDNLRDERLKHKVELRIRFTLEKAPVLLGPMVSALLTKTISDRSRSASLLGRLCQLGEKKSEVKSSKVEIAAQLAIESHKEQIVDFYVTHLLGSKVALHNHRSPALGPFLASYMDLATFKAKVLPVAERMLLRSPEVALPILNSLLFFSRFDISSILPGKLLAAVISSSKSSNAQTREQSIKLFWNLDSLCQDENVDIHMVKEVLSGPKTGKTASLDQRIALLSMIAGGGVPGPESSSDEYSVVIIESLIPAIEKETNDTALMKAARGLYPQLHQMINSKTELPSATLSSLAKLLGMSKMANRRAVMFAIGRALSMDFSNDLRVSAQGEKIIAALSPALETNLQNAIANTPVKPEGYMEGYVAASLALGTLKPIKAAEKLSTSSALSQLLVMSPKPSFLLNERAYSKLPADMDYEAFLNCLQTVIHAHGTKLESAVAQAIGAALVYIAFNHKPTTEDHRVNVPLTISQTVMSQPMTMSLIVRDALQVWLRNSHSTKKQVSSDEDNSNSHHSRMIGRLINAIFEKPIFSTYPTLDAETRSRIAVEYLVLAHHPDISADSQISWIGLVQKFELDPALIVVEQKDEVLAVISSAIESSTQDPQLAQAAYRAFTTLAFLCPSIYIDNLMDRIREDLDPTSLEYIGTEERGIWDTPEDQTFVDVLNNKKDGVENKNRKGYADEQWEKQVRDSVAKKKTTTTLSKADKAAFDAQLAKEAEVREQIRATQASVKRGIELVSSLVASNTEGMKKYVGEMANLLLKSAFGKASFLLDRRPFDVFLALGTLTSERLGENQRMLPATVLRSYDAPLIPEDYLSEDVAVLVTRLMHQLSFMAAQTPFDSTTFALCSLLLGIIVENGGVGTSPASSDEAQEQLILAINIIASCCGEFEDTTYPRLETVRQLLRVIALHPKLARDATAALIDLGDAIRDTATPEEIKEMIAGTLSKESNVRNAALQALQPVDLTDLDYSEELWIAAHDADEQNATLATRIWEENGLDIPETYLNDLLVYLAHESAAVRTSCASALADAAKQHVSQVEPTLQKLQELYVDKARLLQPEYDRFGMVIPETLNRADPWEARVAIASTMQQLTPLIPDQHIAPLFEFFVSKEALGDRHSQVRKNMLDAAIEIIDTHGDKSVQSLMKMFEDYLGRSGKSTETDDYVKEGVVILFGRLAGHLEPGNPRIPQVVDRLVEALNTPSELVQSAVADCLPALVSGMGDDVEYLVDKLFSTLTTGSKYASRRGAAYGLAGVIKGRGLSALKEYDLMEKLQEAAEDKSAYQSRQGAVFAFETLSATLGKIFEPYILSIVPLLLALFGDGNADVREATQDASRVIMSRISGHCVKLMLPTLLGGLEEKQWRTKKGSIELLGSMAFCAPRQLSLSLPTIIPQLTGVINDSHAQVKSAANASLKRFGEVLSNPEIKGILSTLMRALADPAARTNSALSSLLKTSFEHYLDAPSLALVMPIIDRGLKQRSSDTKRRAVQIVGNMASLTESRDLTPYLDQLMPLVHDVLVDPVPEARATAAKSLGTLVERLGEVNFPDLVNTLLQTLRSDTSGVDRQGAAQGLSEVLSGLGMDRLEALLPEIITNTSSPKPYVREGFISLLVYLPATFGHRFAPHLGRVIPAVLNGLADDSEYVREASMRAGKMVIANYSNKAIDLLLPELEKGMLDVSWRIRQSSISLTGELLYRVTGISGKVELEEDEAAAAQNSEAARSSLLEALGQEKRDRVLATLYIVRQDSVSIVRSASIHIWKALVQNTPRTTREILPVLMQILMSLLGSDEIEQQETASRTLGELCRKNGERIFGEIMPILQAAIKSDDERRKEGACLAFGDVMAASNKEVLADNEESIISAIRIALVDSSPLVRSAAARTFDTMQQYMGPKAIDQTIPTLLEAMRDPGESSETALQALQEVMSVRANSVFPVLVPTLTAQPISAFNARALGALVRVAGSALTRRLDTVLGALVKSLEVEKSEDVVEELNSAIEALLASVTDSEGIHQLEMLLLGWARDNSPTRRTTACNLLGKLCQVNDSDMSEYRVDWVRNLISLFDDSSEEVITAAWEALEHFVKTVDKDELEDLVVPLRRTIESIGSKDRKVAGFSRPKGVQSIVPILLAGVLSGTQEQREQAALGIGDLVQRTSETAIKPYIIQLTGPLIRVISSQSISPQIKSAILLTLTTLLEEVPLLVRPFHPQLTRTFVKSTSDPALSVRSRAAAGLGELMKHQTRVDPLVTELIGGIKSSEKDISSSMAQALGAVCESAGKNIGPAAKASIVDLVEDAFMDNRGENYNLAIGRITAGLAKHDSESIRSIADTFLAAPTPPTPIVSTVILAIMEQSPDTFYDLDVIQDIIAKVQASVASDISATARPARESREIMKSQERWKQDADVQSAFR